MKHHITPPRWIRNSDFFKWAMDKIGTRVEDKTRIGRSPVDVGFKRGWEIGDNYRVWYDADYHR